MTSPMNFFYAKVNVEDPTQFQAYPHLFDPTSLLELKSYLNKTMLKLCLKAHQGILNYVYGGTGVAEQKVYYENLCI